MRANRRSRKLSTDRAQVGIGTMIVFIATVLVAAIAAGVLIDTSGKLQERSARTGNEVTSQVSSNVQAVLVQGRRDNSTYANLTSLNITITLAPGAQTVDLSQMKMQINTGTNLKTIGWRDGSSIDGFFNVTELRDADNSFSSALPAMNAGDLVSVNANLTANVLELAPRVAMGIMMIPELGSPVRADFTAPASFGTNTVVELR